MLRVLTLSSLFPDATRPNFGVFVARQTLGLAAHPGVELKVVAPIGLPPLGARFSGRHAALAALPQRESWEGLDVHRPRFAALPATGGRFHAAMLDRALVPVLARIRRDFAFDVIDASFFYPDGAAAVALGRRFAVPVSVKARGADIHLWGNAPATAAQVRAAGRLADGMLAVSAAMKNDMVAMGMPADRIAVHHTGVDLTRFAPTGRAAGKRALGVDGPLVVSIGALIPRKGHDRVIEAVASLPGVSLIVAGDGPERARLAAMIAALGVGDRVRLAGAVAHDRVPALLAAADVMALASTSEGLANVWVEALACGTPIVVPDIGGAAEVVTDPAHGRLVAADPAAIAGGIAALVADPPPVEAVRAGATRFTWEANTAALYDHLTRLVDRFAAAQGNPRHAA